MLLMKKSDILVLVMAILSVSFIYKREEIYSYVFPPEEIGYFFKPEIDLIVGYKELNQVSNGNSNVAIGYQALRMPTSDSNVSIGTYNVCIGTPNSCTGDYNVKIGGPSDITPTVNHITPTRVKYRTYYYKNYSRYYKYHYR